MKKILLIEDEAALQKTLSDFLTANGYEVIQALDGEVGSRLSKTENPDLIIMDLVMPRKTGFEVLADLKKDEKTKEIPVLILTNLESVVDVEKALTAGADNYLVKANYTLNDVLAKVKAVLKD